MKAKDIANFTKTNYGQLASHARGLIVKDMNKGVMQNGIFKYKSKEYAAKKATGALGKFRKSDRVTMLLSGETARRIRPEGKSDRATLVFENGTIVQANEDKGYVIADLSGKNRDSSALFLQKIVDRNVKKYESKPITIKIGK
tara:strand:- start:386 stop:814 length:429 start_codon:yes stop_codon:yes gene_type:complete